MATGKRLTEQGEIRFYEWLEDKIREEGTAVALCNKVGISQGALSALRKGNKAPTEQMVDRIASAYDLTIKDIIGKDGIGADIIPRGDVTGLPKKKKESETQQAESWEMVLRGQIDAVYQDIMKLEEEIRRLRIKKAHYEEILSIYHDWRASHAD